MTDEAMELDPRFEAVVEQAAELARKALLKPTTPRGNFCPFGMVQRENGDVKAIVPRYRGSPRLGELVASLVDSLRRHPQRDTFSVAATCVSGNAVRPESGEVTRAVIISVEEPGGVAQTVLIPTAKGLFGSLLMHERVILPGEVRIFVAV